MYDTTIEHRPSLPDGLNLTHWYEWLDSLATTEDPQARGHLAADTDNGLGYCCLGHGCTVAGIDMVVLPLLDDHGNEITETDPAWVDSEQRYAFAGATDLAPDRFAHWLGLDDHDKFEVDITVAWPMNPPLTAPPSDDTEAYPDGMPYHEDLATASNLNDRGRLTFAQIADVLRYFGTHGVSPT